MAFLEPLRIKMHRYLLRKEMRKLSDSKRRSVSFDNAKKIGIIFNASNFEEEKKVSQYADRLRKKYRKKVVLLGYFDDKDDRDFTDFRYYNQKNLNWIFVPKKEDVKEFMSNTFDIVINFLNTPTLHADYIMALSNASFRVGRNSQNTDSYDLMIDEGQGDVAHFIGLVDMYLRIFNQKPHEPQPQTA